MIMGGSQIEIVKSMKAISVQKIVQHGGNMEIDQTKIGF